VRKDPTTVVDGGMIFTCLSHDEIVHETCHAILDELREMWLSYGRKTSASVARDARRRPNLVVRYVRPLLRITPEGVILNDLLDFLVDQGLHHQQARLRGRLLDGPRDLRQKRVRRQHHLEGSLALGHLHPNPPRSYAPG